MSFTNSNIAAFESALKDAAGVLLAPQQVDLYQGATVSVKLHVSSRRARESEVTGGADVDTGLVATIDYDDWETKVGANRPPQKGDVVWWLGKRHAIARSVPAAPAGNGVFYKARLDG